MDPDQRSIPHLRPLLFDFQDDFETEVPLGYICESQQLCNSNNQERVASLIQDDARFKVEVCTDCFCGGSYQIKSLRTLSLFTLNVLNSGYETYLTAHIFVLFCFT